MVSLPAYVVEPPDELELSVKPAVPDLTLTTVTVQSDGNIDLGLPGERLRRGADPRPGRRSRSPRP